MAQMQTDADLRKRLAMDQAKKRQLTMADGTAQMQPIPLAPSRQPGMTPVPMARPGQGQAVDAVMQPVRVQPPQMADWRQAITKPEPDAVAGPNPADAVRKRIDMQRARGEAQNSLLRTIETPTSGMDPAQKDARIQSIRMAQHMRDNIDGSMQPSIQPQSPERIRAGQGGLYQSGVANMDVEIKRLVQARLQPGADTAAIEGQIREAMMKRDKFGQLADRATATAGPEHDASVAAANQSSINQGKLREKQDVTRAAYGQLAGEDMDKRKAAIELRTKLGSLGGETAVSGLEAGIAQNKAATAQSTFASDPETMKSELKAKQAMAAAQAAKAQSIAGAYGPGGGTTPEAAAITLERRQAAMALAGLGNPEAVNTFKSEAQKQLEGVAKIDSAQDSARALETQTLPKLEELAASDPQAAATLARELLGVMPSGQETAGDLLGYTIRAAGNVGGAMMVAQKRQMARALHNHIKTRLERIAGIGQ